MVISVCDRCGIDNKELPVDFANVILPHPKHRVGFPNKVNLLLCADCQEEVLEFAQTKVAKENSQWAI